MRQLHKPLGSKFGPLEIVFFVTSIGTPRRCLGFVRAYHDPRVQLFGWFCQGGTEFVEQSTLACAIDRLTLLSAGSEPKVGVLFAQAELNRSYCGQRALESTGESTGSATRRALSDIRAAQYRCQIPFGEIAQRVQRQFFESAHRSQLTARTNRRIIFQQKYLKSLG